MIELLVFILPLTSILAADPTEFLVSKISPKNKTVEIPQDIIIKNGVNLHIEVKDPEDSISGAEPPEDSFPATEAEEAGFINIVANHHMFPVEKIAIRVTSAESFIDRTLCFSDESQKEVLPSFFRIFAVSTLSDDKNVRITVGKIYKDCTSDNDDHSLGSDHPAVVGGVVGGIVIILMLSIILHLSKNLQNDNNGSLGGSVSNL